MDGNHIPEEDLVLFALQLLPEDRMREAKKHVDTCELCRTEIAKLQGDLAAYSMTSEFQLPPLASRERLMRQVAKEPRIVPPEPAPAPVAALEGRAHAEPVFRTRQSRTLHADGVEKEEEPKVRQPRRAPWVLAWTGWTVAAGCSFVAGLQFYQRQQMQSSMATQHAQMDETKRQATRAQDALATLTAANAIQMPLHAMTAAKAATPAKSGAAPAPEALVAYLADKGALVFVAPHIDPAPAGKIYELWLMPADGNNPMPAGTFKPDPQGRASLVMPQLPKGIAAKTFEVTVENEGGSNTPTTPVLMSGT